VAGPAECLARLIGAQRYRGVTEADLRAELAGVFRAFGVTRYLRDVMVGDARADFIVGPGTAVIIKLSGLTGEILLDVARMLALSQVTAAVLVTDRARPAPESIGGKPLHVVAIARAG
jgi:hypothetical protein